MLFDEYRRLFANNTAAVVVIVNHGLPVAENFFSLCTFRAFFRLEFVIDLEYISVFLVIVPIVNQMHVF